MNLKAIIASLVLGSSSLAMAAPSVQSTYRPAPVYLPTQPSHGGWSPPAHPVILPVAYQAPVALARGLTFQGQGRRFITVGAQAGRFEKLEINASSGRTFINQVYIQFANGQEQVIRGLNRTLANGECLTLDLDGNKRAIARVVVYGSDLNRGWRRTAGSFSVTAA
jgi:hypothetical protein